MMRRRTWLYLWLVLALGLVTAGCDNPLEIDRDTEISIGRDGARQLEAKYGVVNDPAAQKRLDIIGHRIASVTNEPDLPWTFKILNTKELNALALPGGFIYVTKGMMDYLKNDDQLAGILGHEATHVVHHHAKAAIEKAMTQNLLVELVTQRSSESIRKAASITLDLEMRQGYREKEYEADHYGTLFAFEAGYRADGLRQVLEMLYQKEGDPKRVTWLLQSHPPLSKRIARLDEYIQQLTGRKPR